MSANKKIENHHPLTLDTSTSGEIVSDVNCFQKFPQLTNGRVSNRINPMCNVSYILLLLCIRECVK